jgi:hypothetical protein
MAGYFQILCCNIYADVMICKIELYTGFLPFIKNNQSNSLDDEKIPIYIISSKKVICEI